MKQGEQAKFTGSLQERVYYQRCPRTLGEYCNCFNTLLVMLCKKSVFCVARKLTNLSVARNLCVCVFFSLSQARLIHMRLLFINFIIEGVICVLWENSWSTDSSKLYCKTDSQLIWYTEVPDLGTRRRTQHLLPSLLPRQMMTQYLKLLSHPACCFISAVLT